jgi:hypothetical protein
MANGISFNDPNQGTADVRIYRTSDNIVIKTGDSGTGDVIPATNSNVNFGSSSNKWNTLYGVATSAKYADLAERYTIKDEVEAGDVIVISKDHEFDCELCNEPAPSTILGVISTNPAYRMNEDLENGEFVALCGRVPCKVHGPVQKGDSLVGFLNGAAISKNKLVDNIDTSDSVFAKALETNLSEELVVIEVIIK